MRLITDRFIKEEADGSLHWKTPQLLRYENPNVGLPKVITPDYAESMGCGKVYWDDLPELPPTQKHQWNYLPEKRLVDGVPTWVLGYTLVDKTQEELLAEIPWKDYTQARRAVVAWIDNLTSQIESLYPSSVQKRWLIEEAAARAVAANDGSATADQINMMEQEGAAKGRTALEHAAAVIQNADRFRAIADETNKLFLATDAQLQAAASPLEYPKIFEDAEKAARPLAAAYGLSVEVEV